MDDLDPFVLLNMQADQIKYELDIMLESDEITEDQYNKDLTSLAYEFALNRFPRRLFAFIDRC